MEPTTAAQRGAQARGQLLAAAAELIAEQGWGNVTTRTVAARAGLTPGLVHYHFSSLRELLAQAALGVIRTEVEGLTAALAAADGPERILELLLGALDGQAADGAASLLFTEAYLTAARDEELRSAIGAVLADARRALAARLAGAVPEPDATAAVLLAAFDGILLHRALHPGLSAAEAGPVLRRLLDAQG